jgi:16S rRNA (guanine527-N7)-methyltransferase
MMANAQLETVFGYFPELDAGQREQILALEALYTDWNAKINVISRKDIDNLYLHHVLHSLGIVKLTKFTDDTKVIDIGTGGGFPGIPLAIYYPRVSFHLVDSIGKKIKVAQAVAEAIGLKNVTFTHGRAEEIKTEKYDFAVSRAVATLEELATVSAPLILKKQKNALPNGLICLKGGNDATGEGKPYRNRLLSLTLSKYFRETYYYSKKVIYIPL